MLHAAEANRKILMTSEQKQEFIVKKLLSLVRAAQEVSSTRDVEKLLKAIVCSATKIVDCRDSCLMLLRHESRELVTHVVVGEDKEQMREVRFKVGEGIAGWVAKHGKPILSNDMQHDPRYTRRLNLMTNIPLKSILCVPLISKGNVMGVLNIINKPSGGIFTDQDLRFATAFAKQAAIAIENARLYESMSKENKLLRAQLDMAPGMLKSFNPRMKRLITIARRAAESDATVLLLGESGTGKEIVARAIHTWSARKNYPFIALNCAALPEQLLESELFGHEKGAFTGAISKREGKVELANGGTLFLDEIGELKLEVQTNLLRILQEQQFERVGGIEIITADIRIIAATNRDLVEDVQSGRFRDDLFFRLNVISLTIPPLREKKEDILFLAKRFVEKYCDETGRETVTLSDQARDALEKYSWPGNIRELENVLERAIVLGAKDVIDAGDLRLDLAPPPKKAIDIIHPYREMVRDYKREVIQEALGRSGGNQSRAAERLSITQPYLSRLIKDLALR